MGQWVPEEHIVKVLEAVRDCPQHVFFLLTKNAPRLLKFRWRLPRNLWVGVSAPPTWMNGQRLEYHQQFAMMARALQVLSKLPSPVRWISLEPLTFDVSEFWLRQNSRYPEPWRAKPMLEWIVIGAASSGRVNHQPDSGHVEWMLEVADRWDVPVFMKHNLDWEPRRTEFPAWPVEGVRA
jgi:protein gp37